MTWAILDPLGTGDYSPEGGRTVDFEEKVDHHFLNVLTDEERAGFDNRIVKFRGHVGRKYALKPPGELRDFEKPTQIEITRTYKNLASIFQVVRGMLIVEQAVKEIIESLEPDTHQFWQVDVLMPGGKSTDRNWYAMVITHHLDTFVPEKSDPNSFSGDGVGVDGGRGTYRIFARNKSNYARIAVSRKAIGGAHIWRDVGMAQPNFFVSDEAMAAFDAAGLRIGRHFQVLEV